MLVSDFQYLQPLILIRYPVTVTGIFCVHTDYSVQFRLDGIPTIYTVSRGTITDFASIPKIVPKWIAKKMDGHIEAAVVHDRLCRDRGPWSSKIAADIFLAGMKAAFVPKVTRNLMYQAVLRFGPQWK